MVENLYISYIHISSNILKRTTNWKNRSINKCHYDRVIMNTNLNRNMKDKSWTAKTFHIFLNVERGHHSHCAIYNLIAILTSANGRQFSTRNKVSPNLLNGVYQEPLFIVPDCHTPQGSQTQAVFYTYYVFITFKSKCYLCWVNYLKYMLESKKKNMNYYYVR